MEVLNEFLDAIEIDRLKTIQDFEEQMNQPLDERIAKGVTMSNLKVEFDFYDGLPNQWSHQLPHPQKYIGSAKIICDNNISKFKEGKAVEHWVYMDPNEMMKMMTQQKPPVEVNVTAPETPGGNK